MAETFNVYGSKSMRFLTRSSLLLQDGIEEKIMKVAPHHQQITVTLTYHLQQVHQQDQL